MAKIKDIQKLHIKLKLNYLQFILIGLLIVGSGCEKEEGEGGTSTIYGKILVEEYDSQGNYKGSYYGQDEDVYIIYGKNSETYNDKFTTSYDGSYRFEYLTKGHYTIFAYSDCDTCLSGSEVVFIEHEIEKNKTDYQLNDLVVRR